MYMESSSSPKFSAGSFLELPDEVLQSVSKFLSLRDVSSVMRTSKKLYKVMDEECVYHFVAERQHPPHTLDVSQYDESWKSLLKDGNVQNRLVVKIISKFRLIPVSKSISNSHTVSNAKSVYGMVWDRSMEKILVICDHTNFIPQGTCMIRNYTSPSSPTTYAFQKALNNDGNAAVFWHLKEAILRDDSRSQRAKDIRISGLLTAKFCVISFDQRALDGTLMKRLGIEPSDSADQSLKRFFLDDSANRVYDVSTDFLGVDPSPEVMEEEMKAATNEIDSLHRLMEAF
ncbi:MAG: hypothetical protein SGILL_005554, partial [Bacillariaceae sp.]